MAYLVDTNVFLRLVPKKDPDRKTVLDALRNLSAANEALFYTTQNENPHRALDAGRIRNDSLANY